MVGTGSYLVSDMIILMTSLKDMDQYLDGNKEGLRMAHVTCAFPVDFVVFQWLLRNTAGLKVDCSEISKLLAERFKKAQAGMPAIAKKAADDIFSKPSDPDAGKVGLGLLVN